jgi:hypothetical protein
MPSEEDYNNINPQTYEGTFYQEQEDFGDFDILTGGLEDLESEAQHLGEAVVDIKDLDMLSKLHLDGPEDDEPPQCDDLPYYSRDTDSDTDNETPIPNYESDDSR